jgi:hypothetical protein
VRWPWPSQEHSEQALAFGADTLRIQQSAWHSHNATTVWPGAFALAEFLLRPHARPLLCGARVLELGAATQIDRHEVVKQLKRELPGLLAAVEDQQG